MTVSEETLKNEVELLKRTSAGLNVLSKQELGILGRWFQLVPISLKSFSELSDLLTLNCWSNANTPFFLDKLIHHKINPCAAEEPNEKNTCSIGHFSAVCCFRGHPFMTSTKKSGFWPPRPLCPHAFTWAGSPPCGRPHAVDMKYTPLSWNG